MTRAVTPADAGLPSISGGCGVRRGDGGVRGLSTTIGVIAGLARHAVKKGPMEPVDRAEISIDGGIAGDVRGARRPGSSNKRQVTLMERGDWDAAMTQVGASIPWWERRCNMLVDGIDLPQVPGTQLLLGDAVALEVTRQTDPCERMEALAPGLFAALKRDWRGGVCTRVLHGGIVAIGDVIRIVRI